MFHKQIPLQEYYYSIMLAMIKKIYNTRSLILDAGCGPKTNYYFSQIPQIVNYIGVDISRSNVVSSKKRLRNSQYILADLSNLPFKDGIFNGVICVNVIEHVSNKEAVVGEAARVILRGGFYVGSTTNLYNPALWFDAKIPSLAKFLVQKFAGDHYERHERFSPRELVETFTKYFLFTYCIIGEPQFKSNALFSYLWMFFNKIAENKPWLFFKEMLVWKAIKN